MKKYENPMLQVVSVKSNDIVCTSPLNVDTTDANAVTTQFAPGQRGVFDPYDPYNEGF